MWNLIFVDDLLRRFTKVELNSPTAGEIETYEDQMRDSYPNAFGIRLVSNKKATNAAIFKMIPKLEDYEELSYDDFLDAI